MRKALFFDFWGTLWVPNLEDPSLEAVAEETAMLGIAKSQADAKLKARRWGGFPAHGACSILCKTRLICPQFIVSYSQQRVLDEVLRAWGLWDFFEAIESTHTHNLSKSDLMKKVCLEHQVEPILYVGDSFGDAQMSKELGLRYIHLGKEQDCLDVFGKDHPTAKAFPHFMASFGEILKVVGDEFHLHA